MRISDWSSDVCSSDLFAGALDFSGSGLNGRMQLAAAGDVQRADINARAFAAKIPGAVDFTIGRAIVTGTAILYPAAPSIVAAAQVADLRYGVTTIAEAPNGRRSGRDRVCQEG